MQYSLFDNKVINIDSAQRSKPKQQSYLKCNKIKDNLKQWNTIRHIYRYQTFYKICERLFNETYYNQLACLEYYIDEERDEKKYYSVMYACIEETANLPIKERVLKHIELLRRVRANDLTLERDTKKIDSEVNSLFG